MKPDKLLTAWLAHHARQTAPQPRGRLRGASLALLAILRPPDAVLCFLGRHVWWPTERHAGHETWPGFDVCLRDETHVRRRR